MIDLGPDLTYLLRDPLESFSVGIVINIIDFYKHLFFDRTYYLLGHGVIEAPQTEVIGKK